MRYHNDSRNMNETAFFFLIKPTQALNPDIRVDHVSTNDIGLLG